jgi:ribosome-binding factor A
MAGRRLPRVNQLLREELSRLIREEIKDPRVAEVTITAVHASPDLSHARISVRTLTDRTPVEDAIDGLRSASGFVRHRLGRELHFRRIPELHFEADHTLEHARRIEELLEEALGDEDPD